MLPLDSGNVLLCLRYGIGDVVMELPALDALRAALPGARITALGSAPANELLDGDARVDAVVSTARWGLRHRWDRGDAAVRGSIARWVEEEEFDLLLDVGHAPRAVAEAIWSLGARSLEADASAEQRTLEEDESGSEAIRAAVRPGWGLEIPSSARPRLYPRTSDHAAAEALLEAHGIDHGAPFALSPVASSPLKRWPPERFAAVADHATARTGGPVLILEGDQEEAGRAVVRAMGSPGAGIRIGARHLLTTAAVLQRCAGMVCNDTGLMHISAAVGTPTVGVFGPTRPAFFLPTGGAAAGVQPQDLECGHRETRSLLPPECVRGGKCLIADHGCIHRTRTEDVIAAVDRILVGRGRPGGGRPREHGLHPASAPQWPSRTRSDATP